MLDFSTIVALSTHPGRAAIALVRLSGSTAYQIVTALFDRADELLQRPPANAVTGLITTPASGQLDEVIITRYRQPHSYTGEDLVEISCHGSTYIVEQLLKACCDLGARPATPGEFTRRAFLNDKLDLTGAESVEALINATTAFSHRNALIQLNGRLYDLLRQMRQQIIDLYALLEAELDFSEEEITHTPAGELRQRVNIIIRSQEELLASYRLGRLARGAQVVITGPPNVGKSTLMNRLLREDRVIVTPESGTTRDAVSAAIDIQGILVTLWDTAGLRDTTDAVEQEGIARSQRAIQSADVVIHLQDCQAELPDAAATELISPAVSVLQVWNKYDLNPQFTVPAGQLAISAATGTGIEELLATLYETLTGGEGLPGDEVLLTNLRHYQLLQQARQHLLEVKRELSAGVDHSLVVIFLRDAAEAIGSIDGSFDIEEVLDGIFSRFCIGK